MSFLISLVIALVFVGLIVTALRKAMHHRAELRRIGREAESLDVLSNDTRRAMWYSAADHDYHPGSDSGGDASTGGGGGGD